MDLRSLEWSENTLQTFGLKESWLPQIVKDSSADFGKVSASECAALAGVPITGVLGDQQAACLGHILRQG